MAGAARAEIGGSGLGDRRTQKEPRKLTDFALPAMPGPVLCYRFLVLTPDDLQDGQGL